MKVKCINNHPTSSWMIDKNNASLLEMGKEYNVVKVDVHSCYTIYYLEGFGNSCFNSVWFVSETEEKEIAKTNKTRALIEELVSSLEDHIKNEARDHKIPVTEVCPCTETTLKKAHEWLKHNPFIS